MFANNAELIYNLSVENNFNPEIVVVRAVSEGFSPFTSDNSTNNFWGNGCSNKSGNMNRYNSFEEGILGLINIMKGYNVDTVFEVMSFFSDLGDVWLKPGSDNNGGCYYLSEIKDLLPPDRLRIAEEACSGDECTGDEPNCVPTTEEDQNAYTEWQVNEMKRHRKNIFKIGC